MATGITYITTDGAILAAKTMESKILKFSKFKVGDGTLTSDDVDTIKALKDLVNPLLSFNVTNIVRDNETRIDVQGVFQNTDADSAFWMRELGLYAIDPDTEEEVLFAYINYGDKAEYINNSISEKQERFYDMFIVVDNAENVTIEIDPTVSYVSKKTFETAIAGVQNEIKQAVSTVYKPKGSVEYYANLPTENNAVGDVYNVKKATSGVCKAGDNVVWVGTDQSEDGWDILAGTVDLSAYLTSETAATTYVSKSSAEPTTITLPTTSFTLDETEGLYKAVITDNRITATSMVIIDPARASRSVVDEAKFEPDVDVAVGTATIYCANQPTASIALQYTVIGGN